MINLLYSVILGESGLIMILLFKTPLRNLTILGLDRLKRGKGPIMLKTVSGTVFVLLLSTLYNIANIQSRAFETLNPTDQVILSTLTLEASLMGFVLFLALMIDRLHNYIRELRLLRTTMEGVKNQNRVSENGKNGSSEKLKVLREAIAALKSKIKKLESEWEVKEKEVKTAQDNADALKQQSEGFLLEYDHLLEDNHDLLNQLKAINEPV